MAFVRAASRAALHAGDLIEVQIGERFFAVCNVAGSIRALEGICPHRGGPLGQGAMYGENVVCPWHAWEFDSTTGQADGNVDACLKTYPVKIEGDDILIDA